MTMASLEWDERYSTGLASIDRQHKELFKTMRRLHEAYRQGRGEQEIGAALEFLSRYAQEHFADEETYMEYLEFPDRRAHRLEHLVLTHRVEELQNRYLFDDPTTGMAASQLLYEWLRDHILQKDFAYIVYARETGQH
jgi:hemerythrin-like metal-binding protein